MNRYKRMQVWGVAALLVLAVGCGDDDDDTSSNNNDKDASPDESAPATGKALSALTAAEINGLCAELLKPVRDASTPEQQCVEVGLEEDTAADCDTARKECLADEAYQDFSKVRCATFTASSAPKFDCDTKVSEVTACYAKVATWLKGLKCSQAGKSEDLPACVDELDTDCDFGFSKLVEQASTGCDRGDLQDCTCSGGAKGKQECDSKGEFGACACGSMNGSEYVCTSGSQSYSYDFGGGAACNKCAIDSCCPSFIACEGNTDCNCYWKCLGEGKDDCLAMCKLTTYPTQFEDHALCLSDACGEPCELQ